MALLLARPVEALGIAHVQGFQNLLQSIFCRGDQDQVNVIGHQAISRDFHLEFGRIFTEPSEIGLAVLIIKKHILAAVSALGDVVGQMGEDGSGGAWHAEMIAVILRQVKGNVPFFSIFLQCRPLVSDILTQSFAPLNKDECNMLSGLLTKMLSNEDNFNIPKSVKKFRAT
jgi:hypothetical protein